MPTPGSARSGAGVWGGVAALTVMAMWVAARPAPLHEDEAIYAAWARTIANGTDLWLTATPVDKPPLYLYALAGVFRLFGESPVTARGLNVAVMIGVVLMLVRLSRRPAVSVALLASTPLVPFMAGSAFTDPLMVLCILGGWLAGRTARPGWAGLACGLAAAVKPTAVLLWPVVIASVRRQGASAGTWRRFAVGVTTPLALMWAWDASRTAPSWWLLGWRAYGTLGRTLSSWSAWWPPLLLSLGASWIALGWHTPLPKNATELNVVRGLFAVWVPLHIGLGFQPWDRYLFPLAVLIAWAAGETAPSHRLMAALTTNALLLALLLSVPHPLLAGRDSRWEGIAQMATLLSHTSGPIYHRELGRPLAFYAPSVSKRLVWLPPGTSPPPGSLWAGRHSDVECGRALWQNAHSGLALCVTRPP